MKNILVVDDEVEIVELIELYLSREDFRVFRAFDGEEALEIIKGQEISLAVVDIMMPRLNGFQLIREIRKSLHIPVIVLSARDDFSDKILGLDLGADDYMTKPFNPLELTARVQAQFRRVFEFSAGTAADEKKDIISTGDLQLDKESCTPSKNQEILPLTSTEYRIMEYLLSNLGRVFTKQQIFEHVWNESYYDDENAIGVHISNLRDKIENDPKNPLYLKTVRGLGYKIERL